MGKLLVLFVLFCGLNAASYAQDSLQQYAGKYNFPEGSVVREIVVSVENNLLTLGSVLGKSSLVKDTEDSFVLPSLNGIAMFKRDGNKKVTNLKLDLMGLKIEGIKDAENVINAAGSATDRPIIIIWETKLLTNP